MTVPISASGAVGRRVRLHSAQDESKAESGVIVAAYHDGPSKRFLIVAGTHLVDMASETLFDVLDEPDEFPGAPRPRRKSTSTQHERG
jgi:hypothetical protein